MNEITTWLARRDALVTCDRLADAGHLVVIGTRESSSRRSAAGSRKIEDGGACGGTLPESEVVADCITWS